MKTPTISVLIPTRGRTSFLDRCIRKSIATSVLPTTRFVIGTDADRPEDEWYGDSEKTIWCCAPREDSLGAKYNRCKLAVDADIYVLATDDVAFATEGWDLQIAHFSQLFSDGLFIIHFGIEPHGELYPSAMAVSKKMIEVMRCLCPPFFPFWWNNTWLYEIGDFTGRGVWMDLATKYPPDDELPPAHRRDIPFWAKFFEDTRTIRLDMARKVVEASNDPPWRKVQLMQQWPRLVQWWEMLHEPLQREGVTFSHTLETPDDERHRRLRKQAERVRENIRGGIGKAEQMPLMEPLGEIEIRSMEGEVSWG